MGVPVDGCCRSATRPCSSRSPTSTRCSLSTAPCAWPSQPARAPGATSPTSSPRRAPCCLLTRDEPISRPSRPAVLALADARASCRGSPGRAGNRARRRTRSRSRCATTAPTSTTSPASPASPPPRSSPAHTGTPWRVAFGGFAPGFAYLVGGDPRLRVPRRDRPRPSVPAGAVGLAGEFSGVYPRSSPGGWQLLGTHRRRAVGRRPRPARAARPGHHGALRRRRRSPT